MSNLTSKLSNMEVYLLTSFASLQVIVGSTANFLVIILFAKSHELRLKNSDLLILNLALVDLISLTTFLPWNIYLTNLGRPEYKENYTSLNTFCLFLSGTAVLTIAIDKFVAVVYPLRYATFVTRTRTLLMIFCSWLVAVALGIAHFLVDVSIARGDHDILDKTLSAVVLLEMIFVASLYAVVFKAVKNQLSSRRNLDNSNSLATPQRKNQENGLLKSALNTFIVVCLFYATYLPYAVLQMMAINSISDFVVWRRLFSFIYINSCINPFVYFFRIRRFRIVLLYIFNKGKRLEVNARLYLSRRKINGR